MAELSGVADDGPESNGDHKVVSYMDDTDLLIDYSLLTSSPEKAAHELDKFKSALTSWGCFQLINHGIATSFLDELIKISRQFFGLSEEVKQRYAMPKGGTNGYDHITVDWNEGLSLTVHPEDRRKLEFWPENPSDFKLLEEYTKEMTPIIEELFKLVFRSLNIDEKKFGEKYGKNKETTVRLNFYPQCPSSNRGLGLQPHADFSAMTLVLQDEEGLEILKDGQWLKVPVIPRALVLNLGDTIEIISNGILKSPVHRVVTNTERSRMSIAMFWDSDRNCEIRPLDELVTASRPQQYETVSLVDYTTKFYQDFHSGKRLIDTIRIPN